jgi:signal transduction histidine kinase/ActR/RegA family two-component response regulator
MTDQIPERSFRGKTGAMDPQTALRQLTRFAHLLLQRNSLDDLLWDIAQNIGELLGFDDCVVYVAEPEGLVQSAAFGIKNPREREIYERLTIAKNHGIVGYVASTGKPLITNDTSLEPRYLKDCVAGRSELTIPIIYEGVVIGVFDCESAFIDDFSDSDQVMLTAVATLAAPRIASAIAERNHKVTVANLVKAEADYLQREQELVADRLVSLGQLAGGIAHDFNNLLAAILGNISLARFDLPPGTSLDLLTEAEVACERAQSLTKQLLTFSRGGDPVMLVQDLGKIVRDSIQFALRGTNTAVRFDIDNALPLATLDIGQITQVFHNLAINASQATPAGGTLHVTVRNQPTYTPPCIEVRCQDDGPGVSVENRLRIFDPYFTTKACGTGLGLATSFWIMRRHKGSLLLDTTVPSGACFVVNMPTTAEEPPGLKILAHLAGPKGLKILVMDDEPSLRNLLSRMLTRIGHTVQVAATSDELLAIWRANRTSDRPFDVLVLDLTMPGDRSGHATLKLIHAEDPSVRAIVTSGYHSDPVLSNPRHYGFRTVLEKPFKLDDLQAALEAAVAQ